MLSQVPVICEYIGLVCVDMNDSLLCRFVDSLLACAL